MSRPATAQPRRREHPPDAHAVARFWAKVDRSGGPDACWPWTGSLNGNGYGLFSFERRSVRAHRFAFLLAHGEFPRQMTDHTCHNGSGCRGGRACPHRACCNPRHLEDVSRSVNTARGNAFVVSPYLNVTHCKRGHEFTPANTWRDKHGWRFCRECNRIRQAGTQARRRMKEITNT